jgi:hypothetical protein
VTVSAGDIALTATRHDPPGALLVAVARDLD